MGIENRHDPTSLHAKQASDHGKWHWGSLAHLNKEMKDIKDDTVG